jgi:hypothetical protein
VRPFPTIKIQPKTATTFTVQYKHGVRALAQTFTMESMAKDNNFTTLKLNPGSMEAMAKMEKEDKHRMFNYSKKKLQVLLNLGESKTGARVMRDPDTKDKFKTREKDLQETGSVYEVRLYDKNKLDQTEVQGNLVTVKADSEPMRRTKLSNKKYKTKVGKVVGYVQRYVCFPT